jgi:hypothetical protein
LVDKTKQIAFGQHYKFIVNDGSIVDGTQLHSRCFVENVPDLDNVSKKMRARFERGQVHLAESTPERSLPSESALLQAIQYPDLPAKISYFTKVGFFHFDPGFSTVPTKYSPHKNPCKVVELSK